ncbi:MAG: hypothetical protein LBJ14_06610 [Desulfarculales bacterium]|jgi:hypothetical protein|nr:hypothetical protein [Desulfarculales bacterium]
MQYYGTLKEIAIKLATKQKKEVDLITEEAPLLDIIKWMASTHGLWNLAEEITNIIGASFVDMNAPLPVVGSTSELKKMDLQIMGGKMEVAQDTAIRFGGPAAYFAKHLDWVRKQTGMDTEKHIYYNTWLRYAIEHGLVTDAGGTNNTNFSMLFIRFEEGVNCGLYDAEGIAGKEILKVFPMYGGNLYEPVNGRYAGVPCYGQILKAYLGYQILDPRTIHAIVNIDPDHIPSAAMIDDAIAEIRGTQANTHIIMHVKARNLLNKYKEDRLNIPVGEKNYSRSIMDWDGIRIETSYNLLAGTETNVTV